MVYEYFCFINYNPDGWIFVLMWKEYCIVNTKWVTFWTFVRQQKHYINAGIIFFLYWKLTYFFFLMFYNRLSIHILVNWKQKSTFALAKHVRMNWIVCKVWKFKIYTKTLFFLSFFHFPSLFSLVFSILTVRVHANQRQNPLGTTIVHAQHMKKKIDNTLVHWVFCSCFCFEQAEDCFSLLLG